MHRYVVLTRETYGGIRGSISTFDTVAAAREWAQSRYSDSYDSGNWRILPIAIYAGIPTTYALICEAPFAGARLQLFTYPDAILALEQGKNMFGSWQPRAVGVLAESPPAADGLPISIETNIRRRADN